MIAMKVLKYKNKLINNIMNNQQHSYTIKHKIYPLLHNTSALHSVG